MRCNILTWGESFLQAAAECFNIMQRKLYQAATEGMYYTPINKDDQQTKLNRNVSPLSFTSTPKTERLTGIRNIAVSYLSSHILQDTFFFFFQGCLLINLHWKGRKRKCNKSTAKLRPDSWKKKKPIHFLKQFWISLNSGDWILALQQFCTVKCIILPALTAPAESESGCFKAYKWQRSTPFLYF